MWRVHFTVLVGQAVRVLWRVHFTVMVGCERVRRVEVVACSFYGVGCWWRHRGVLRWSARGAAPTAAETGLSVPVW